MKILSKLRSSVILGIGLCLMGSGYGSKLLQSSQNQSPLPTGWKLSEEQSTIIEELKSTDENGLPKYDCGNLLIVCEDKVGESHYIVFQSGLISKQATDLAAALNGKGVGIDVYSGGHVIGLLTGKRGDDLETLKDQINKLSGINNDSIINNQCVFDILNGLSQYVLCCAPYREGDYGMYEGSDPSAGITEHDNYEYYQYYCFKFLNELKNLIKPPKKKIKTDEDEHTKCAKACLEELLKFIYKGGRFERKKCTESSLSICSYFEKLGKGNCPYSLKKFGKEPVFCSLKTKREEFYPFRALKYLKRAMHTEIQLAVLLGATIHGQAGDKFTPLISIKSNIFSLFNPCVNCKKGAPLVKLEAQGHNFIFVRFDNGHKSLEDIIFENRLDKKNEPFCFYCLFTENMVIPMIEKGSASALLKEYPYLTQEDYQ